MNKIKKEDLNEYNGSWCKKNKDGFCDNFTMIDLKELLVQQKEEIMGEMDGLKKDGSEINYEEDNYASGYNKALEDILKAIEKL